MLWLLPALLLAAEPALTVELAARIELDQQKAAAAVMKRFGDKRSSELTADERRELIRALAEADRAVLDRHGVDAKAWARYGATQGRAATAARQAQVKELADEERKAAEARAAQVKEPVEIPVQRGISDEQPAVLEETAGAPPVVEQGLPPEARADEEAARDADSAESAAEQPAKKAEKKPGKHR